MAVVNTLNSPSNLLGYPQTAAQLTGQKVKRIRRTFTITSGDSANSIYLLGEVPDYGSIRSITVEMAGLVTSVTSATVGLWDSQGNLKNATAYSSGLDLASSTGTTVGDFGGNQYRCTSRTLNTTAPVQMVFQDAGDVEGPFPQSGQTIKDSKYQVGLQIGQNAGATEVGLAVIEYEAAE